MSKRVYILPRWIEKTGEVVAKIPFAKKCLIPIYYPFKDWINKKRNKQFLTRGLDVLNSFDKCLTENDIPYMLGFGTLLGAVREHGFIQHDLDIDTCMWYKDYKEKRAKYILEKAGFQLIRSFSIDGGESGLEQTYLKDGVTIDVFMIYPPVDKLPFSCHWWMPYGDAKDRYESMKKFGFLIPFRFEAPYCESLNRIDFSGLMLPVPKDYDDILSLRYGSDYMTPNPQWHDSLDYFIRWDAKRAIMENY